MSTRNWALGLTLGVAALATTSTASAGMLEDINATLAADGANVRVYVAEALTSDGNSITIYAKDVGNKQLTAHWVKGDPWRGGWTDISWIVDESEGATASGLTAADTYAAIDRAMATWDGVDCSTIPLYSMGSYDYDFGYVQFLLGYGGVPTWFADVTHAGWLPGGFYDLLAPGGSNFILGVTFTFIWVDDVTEEPTDMNGDHKNDTAFREIYYNDNFTWNIDANFDVETIALHEVGHGLSQAHFGTIFVTPSGHLQFAPRAVMNAAYSGVQQELTGTDIAGHCSIWASW
ncbi:MAG: hypothetical protein JRI25_19445 [Deltaproteobacteria bacterium]|nr:hypothetical protein [Deltaproteobacteria bacterium]